MATLTARQVAGIASQGTPSGTTVAEWVALADRESSYRDHITNGNAVGLWQIMVTAHRAKINAAVGRELSESEAKEAMKVAGYNWIVAKAIYAESGWRPWEASHSPTEAHRTAAAQPDSSVAQGFQPGITGINPSDILGGLLPEPLEPIAQVARALEAALTWISDPNTWRRIGLVVAGVGIALVAVNTLVKGTDYYQDLESQITGVTKAVATKGASTGGPMKQTQEA